MVQSKVGLSSPRLQFLISVLRSWSPRLRLVTCTPGLWYPAPAHRLKLLELNPLCISRVVPIGKWQNRALYPRAGQYLRLRCLMQSRLVEFVASLLHYLHPAKSCQTVTVLSFSLNSSRILCHSLILQWLPGPSCLVIVSSVIDFTLSMTFR